MLNVVSEPRVMSNRLPMRTISMSLVGLLSRSTPCCRPLRGLGAEFIATATSAWASGGVVGAVAGHGHEPPAPWYRG